MEADSNYLKEARTESWRARDDCWKQAERDGREAGNKHLTEGELEGGAAKKGSEEAEQDEEEDEEEEEERERRRTR